MNIFDFFRTTTYKEKSVAPVKTEKYTRPKLKSVELEQKLLDFENSGSITSDTREFIILEYERDIYSLEEFSSSSNYFVQ